MQHQYLLPFPFSLKERCLVMNSAWGKTAQEEQHSRKASVFAQAEKKTTTWHLLPWGSQKLRSCVLKRISIHSSFHEALYYTFIIHSRSSQERRPWKSFPRKPSRSCQDHQAVYQPLSPGFCKLRRDLSCHKPALSSILMHSNGHVKA